MMAGQLTTGSQCPKCDSTTTTRRYDLTSPDCKWACSSCKYCWRIVQGQAKGLYEDEPAMALPCNMDNCGCGMWHAEKVGLTEEEAERFAVAMNTGQPKAEPPTTKLSQVSMKLA